MAAVTKGTKVRPCMPVGYERVSHIRTVTEDVEAGDLLILGANGWSLSDGTDPDGKYGFAAQDYAAGRKDCSVLGDGEMDGFTGLTAGTPLFPSTTVEGGLDTTAVVGFTGRIHAVSATMIEFSL